MSENQQFDKMHWFVTTTVLGVLLFIFYILKRRFTYWSRQGVPGPSVFECFKAFQGVTSKSDKIWVKKYGPVFGVFQLFDPTLIVNDADLIKEMIKDFNKFPDHVHAHWGNNRLAKNLFNLPGDDDWKRVRSVMSPAFTSGKLKRMMESMSELTDKLVANIEPKAKSGQMIDMKLQINAFVMDIITTCAYGVKIDSINNKDHPIVVNARKAFGFDANLSTALCIGFPKIAKLLNLALTDKSAVDFFDALTERLVHQRKGQSDSSNRSDFLQLMINAIEEMGSNKALSMEEVVAQGILFFIAGYDSSASAMSHTLFYLAKHSDIQEELHQQLAQLDEINLESLDEVKFLDAVIYESMRLEPPFLRFNRTPAEDGVLGSSGIKYKKGMLINVMTQALHRDPRYWKEPDKFKPERFLKPEHHPYAYVAFGHGPRQCIGMRFAMNEMRMCIGKLISNYRFRLPKEHQKLEYFTGNVVNTPKNVYLFAEKR